MDVAHSASLGSAAVLETGHMDRTSDWTLIVELGSSASERVDDSGAWAAGSSHGKVVTANSAPVDDNAWRLEYRNCSTWEMASLTAAGLPSPAIDLWTYNRKMLIAGGYFHSAKH